jgi:hypothetical protein
MSSNIVSCIFLLYDMNFDEDTKTTLHMQLLHMAILTIISGVRLCNRLELRCRETPAADEQGLPQAMGESRIWWTQKGTMGSRRRHDVA